MKPKTTKKDLMKTKKTTEYQTTPEKRKMNQEHKLDAFTDKKYTTYGMHIHTWAMLLDDSIPPHLEDEIGVLREFVEELTKKTGIAKLHEMTLVKLIKLIAWLRWVYEKEKINPPDFSDYSISNMLIRHIFPISANQPLEQLESGLPITNYNAHCLFELVPRTFPFDVLFLTCLAEIYSSLSYGSVFLKKGSKFLRLAEEIHEFITGRRYPNITEYLHYYAREYRNYIVPPKGLERVHFTFSI